MQSEVSQILKKYKYSIYIFSNFNLQGMLLKYSNNTEQTQNRHKLVEQPDYSVTL